MDGDPFPFVSAALDTSARSSAALAISRQLDGDRGLVGRKIAALVQHVGDGDEVDAVSLETFSQIARVFVPEISKVLLPDPRSTTVYAALWSADGISRLSVPGAVEATMKLPGVSRNQRPRQQDRAAWRSRGTERRSMSRKRRPERKPGRHALVPRAPSALVGSAPRHVVRAKTARACTSR